MDTTSILTGIAAAPIIAALISGVIKPLIANDKFYPLIALAVGIAWNVAATAALIDPLAWRDVGAAALVGIITGLAASGVYNSYRTYLPPGG